MTSNGLVSLIHKETVFVSESDTQEKVFFEISTKLYDSGLVSPLFFENIVRREADYPTGIDLSSIASDFPCVAIPHTEAEYCLDTRIVPVKLMNPIPWHSMLDPSLTFNVTFLFMLLNNGEEEQVQMLALLMDYFNRLGNGGNQGLFNVGTKEELLNELGLTNIS